MSKQLKAQEQQEMRATNGHVFRETYISAIVDAQIPVIEKMFNEGKEREDNRHFRRARIKCTTGHLRGGLRLGKMPAETHFPADPDGQIEIMIRIDQDNPQFIAKLVWHQLIHILTTPEHSKEFGEAAVQCGGIKTKGDGLRGILPGVDYTEKHIDPLIKELSDYPHRALSYADYERKPEPNVQAQAVDAEGVTEAVQPTSADALKKQKGRLRNAKCMHPGCGFNVNLSRKQAAEVGPPCCFRHGLMTVELKKGDDPIDDPDLANAFWLKPAPDTAMNGEFREVEPDEAKGLPAPSEEPFEIA